MFSFLRALAQYKGKCALATRRRFTKDEAWWRAVNEVLVGAMVSKPKPM